MIQRMRTENGALHAAQLHGGPAPAEAGNGVAPVGVAEEVTGTAVADAMAPAAAADPVVAELKPARKPSKWGPRVAWTLSMTAIGAIVGVVIVLGMKFIDGPVEATQSGPTLAKAQAAATPAPESALLGGLTFELSYPGVFDQVGTVKNGPHAIEQYNIGSKASYSRLIAVSVMDLPSNNPEDDSSFRYRQTTPQTYTSGNLTVHGEPAAMFTKNDRTERTFFWAHKGRLLTVSITSSDPHDDIEAYMALIVKTARWKV